jgi:hypothetical protein
VPQGHFGVDDDIIKSNAFCHCTSLILLICDVVVISLPFRVSCSMPMPLEVYCLHAWVTQNQEGHRGLPLAFT